jgi:hypothetical protein
MWTFVGKGATVMPWKLASTNEIYSYNRKFAVALVAAGIAIWVMIFHVEIDATIETLILTLSPIIVAYWCPEPNREAANAPAARKSPSGFDSDVVVALIAALVIYVGLQFFVGLTSNGTLEDLPWGVKSLIALVPVIVGILTSPA